MVANISATNWFRKGKFSFYFGLKKRFLRKIDFYLLCGDSATCEEILIIFFFELELKFKIPNYHHSKFRCIVAKLLLGFDKSFIS